MNLLTTLLLATLTLGPDAGNHESPESSPIRLVTGNLSVDVIQHSAIGAHPDPAFRGGPPSLEELVDLREQGLHGYEDYIAWGTVEPEEGSFDWSHHEAVAQRLAEAGLPYIPYIWCHFPPTWLRDDERATLMRCNAHGQPCNMLSIFDPRTLDWYERFYRALYAHFGDRIAETYACILGPYGEGNYPLPYVNWVVNLGHCHEGYWCGDPYALPLFQKAMRDKYGTLASLNAAWKSGLKSFEEIRFPPEIAAEVVPSFEDRPAAERRRWLDFIHWYHQALIDFAGGAVDRAAKAFGIDKIAIKPGGNAGWMNPVSWGTYNPGFARMASRRGIAMQTADSRGVYWADQWTSTAYRFYGVPYRTESAGNLDRPTFIKRTFTDASCGSSRLFTYEIRKFLPDCRRSLHLYNGERSLTDVALLAPTTYYYLSGDVLPAIHRGKGCATLSTITCWMNCWWPMERCGRTGFWPPTTAGWSSPTRCGRSMPGSKREAFSCGPARRT